MFNNTFPNNRMYTLCCYNVLQTKSLTCKLNLIAQGYIYLYSRYIYLYSRYIYLYSQSQWPCGLRRRSAADRLLRSWVQIQPETWMFVCCECPVLSGRGLCEELITRPEESYRLWCVVVCDLETSRMRRP